MKLKDPKRMMNKRILISNLNTLLLVADTYVSAPAPLADREGVGTSAEEYTFLWNIVLLFSPQFGHFLTVKESWKKKKYTLTTLISVWASKTLNPLNGVSCFTYHLCPQTPAFLTFDDWQAFLLHYKHGISVSLFHNESLQPSDLFPTRKTEVTHVKYL